MELSYSGILIIMWFQGLIPAKSQGSHGNWIWLCHSYWKLQFLKFSFCKMCCWPTSASSWTNVESWAEFWRMMVFHEKRKKRISQKQIYIKWKCSWCYWANVPLVPEEGDSLCRYVCLQVQEKKEPSGNVAKVPTRPHILETLSCKEPQPPHLQIQTKAFPSLLWLSCIIRNKNERQHLLSIKMIEMMNKFP